jgi:hypothetical protein
MDQLGTEKEDKIREDLGTAEKEPKQYWQYM